MTPDESLGKFIGLGKARRVLETRLEAKPSTLVLKEKEAPNLWPEVSARADTPVVIHRQVAK
jgi:hypothetical protein